MSSQDRWNNICETCKDAGAKVLQNKKINQKHQDDTLNNLSNRNQKLKTEINGSKKEETRNLKKQILTRIKVSEESILNKDLAEIEMMKVDSNRCYAAI